MGNQSGNNDNIFKILVATDNHLGYAEKDSERANDSFISFEEVLQLANEKEVDFILLGGDLFHENKPSRSSLMKCMQLLRRYTFGDKPVHFDFVSDPAENFPHLKDPAVNYQDPNLNVSIPVFSIHGNHDDPAGMGQFCALDMLSTAGLVNYFGRVTDLKEIKISPLLMTKGQTKLALYGLSAVKDERLYRLFKENKVKMLRPKEDFDDWFNIMVLHQNHTRHSLTNYLPEQFLDKFLHLVIWGHEHECKVEARLSEPGTFFVMQPGSSVATSLCAGEAIQKSVALLEVNCDKNMRVTPLTLKSVRPFVFKNISLADEKIDMSVGTAEVEKIIEKNIWQMIEESKSQLTGHVKQPTKPLIRLRVEYTDECQLFNIYRFGHKFSEDIANPDDVILFKKFSKDVKKKDILGFDQDAMDSVFDNEVGESKVEDLVQHYFAEMKNDKMQLELLTERGLAWAVGQYIEKDYKDSMREIFGHQIEKISQHLLTKDDLTEENIEDYAALYHGERLKRSEEEEQKILDSLATKSKSFSTTGENDNDSDADLLADEIPKKPTRGGRGRAGRSRGRGTIAGSSRAASTKDEGNIDVEWLEDDIPKPMSRGKGRGRRSSRVSPSTRTSTSRTTLRMTEDIDDIPERGRGQDRRATTSRGRTPSVAESFQRMSQRSTTKRMVISDSESD